VKPLDILFVAELVPGSRSWQRIDRLREMGHRVTEISLVPEGDSYERRPGLIERIRYRLRIPEDRANAAGRILDLASRQNFDIAWFERATTLSGGVLRKFKHMLPECRLVWYAEDDMMNPAHLSRQVESAIPVYDLWVTTKSFNTEPGELPARGARHILFVNNAYDRDAHSPAPADPEADARFAADISFVGTYEKPRSDVLRTLAEAGLKVRVWGNGWEKMDPVPDDLDIAYAPVYGEDYRRVVGASRINLCFLRKGNRDLQTCRSFEIPAIGGFMLHEESPEMAALLEPDREAGYFSGVADIVACCNYWLADDDRRKRVAQAGRRKMLTGGHEHQDRLETIIGAAMGTVES
jgi:spore maturation protein CgeB